MLCDGGCDIYLLTLLHSDSRNFAEVNPQHCGEVISAMVKEIEGGARVKQTSSLLNEHVMGWLF